MVQGGVRGRGRGRGRKGGVKTLLCWQNDGNSNNPSPPPPPPNPSPTTPTHPPTRHHRPYTIPFATLMSIHHNPFSQVGGGGGGSKGFWPPFWTPWWVNPATGHGVIKITGCPREKLWWNSSYSILPITRVYPEKMILIYSRKCCGKKFPRLTITAIWTWSLKEPLGLV